MTKGMSCCCWGSVQEGSRDPHHGPLVLVQSPPQEEKSPPRRSLRLLHIHKKTTFQSSPRSPQTCSSRCSSLVKNTSTSHAVSSGLGYSKGLLGP